MKTIPEMLEMITDVKLKASLVQLYKDTTNDHTKWPAQRGLFLTDEQLHAVTFHHGGWSEFVKYGSDMSPLATVLHCADMLSAKCTPYKDSVMEDEV